MYLLGLCSWTHIGLCPRFFNWEMVFISVISDWNSKTNTQTIDQLQYYVS